MVGTVVRGIRTPIFKNGDCLPEMIPQILMEFYRQENVQPRDRDIVAMTESIVARAQGNYASVDAIAKEIAEYFPQKGLGILFPILSRNRFSAMLRAFARGNKHLIIQLSFPADEVGNHLVSLDQLDEAGINPWTDVLTEENFRRHFGVVLHKFSHIDYISFYRDIVESEGAQCTILLSNRPQTLLEHTSQILCCDVHSRKRTKRILRQAGAQTVLGLEDLLTSPKQGEGFNPEYGLLGSNLSSAEELKLFPRGSQELVEGIQKKLHELTGRTIEVMVYGDGAFKDPAGQIWELADPVVSPGYTAGLAGGPNELKLKYLADNQFAHLKGEELKEALSRSIREKQQGKTSENWSLGTTPRRFTDLIGSLCDLTSGSGDKGTPLIYIQGYFDSFAD
jgi:F420-0:gamma-glutamyl ligase